jgi:hypothetical protein
MALPLGDGYGSVGPCAEVTTVVTNTDQTFSPVSRAVYISTNGDLSCTLAFASASVTFSSVVGGSWLPIRVKTIHACPAGTLALW